MRDFTKDDLRNGMLVKTRCGYVYLYVEYDTMNVFVRERGHICLNDFDDDLILYSNTERELDIVEVYEPRGFISTLKINNEINNAQLIWKREEKPVEMTIAEIEEKLGIKNLKVVKES